MLERGKTSGWSFGFSVRWSVFFEGRELPLGPLKDRTVLGVLLLHANEVVPRQRLIDELWGEAPPPTAIKAVNGYVSQLRKALGGNGAGPIATRPPGYLIEVAADKLDVSRFAALTVDARAQANATAFEAASTIYAEALSLWRGRTLSGIELESVDRHEIERLDEARVVTLMDRIDCDLALGRQDDLVGELEVLVAQHPLRERLHAQRILALYRSGRQAEALRAYQRARAVLVEELGLEPSPALQRLERGILNHDASLQTPAGTAHRNGARATAVTPPSAPATDAVATASASSAACWGLARSPGRRRGSCCGHAGQFDGAADRGAEPGRPARRAEEGARANIARAAGSSDAHVKRR